jgi:beta-galactosidase
VTVVDADSVPVYDSTADLTWQVDGPARLLGLESGDHRSLEDYGANHRRVFHGRLLGYVQATKTSGPVTVTLTSPGLEPAVVALRAK